MFYCCLEFIHKQTILYRSDESTTALTQKTKSSKKNTNFLASYTEPWSCVTYELISGDRPRSWQYRSLLCFIPEKHKTILCNDSSISSIRCQLREWIGFILHCSSFHSVLKVFLVRSHIRQNFFQIDVFWAVIPCSLGDGYQCFGGMCSFHHQNL
jgi:hypothetical protein